MRTATPFRRLVIAAGLLIAVLVACGREITGPVSEPVNVFKRFAAFAFESKVESAIPASALRAALQQVAFERVRITLRREDGTIALDTVVLFPVGATEMTLTLNVPLPASAPSTGVPLSLNLGYINAAGDTVFKGGPLPVTVVPGTGGTPPAPVQVPIHYTGPGATAAAVAITPKTFSGTPGQTTTFTAQAFSATGQQLPGTPIAFTSRDDAVVTINEATGVATLRGRGTTKVYALLLTGPADSAVVTVTLPASQLQLVSGGGQTAPAGASLAQPVVARVVASDGIGVAGVTVTFAAGGGGTVTPATAVSDAAGNVSTQWKLGPTAGAQSLTVSSAGLTGSPLTVSATAQSITPTKLAIQTGPASGKAATALPAIAVAAQDAAGNVVATFTGDVTVAIGVNPGGSTLSGTTTVKAVAGVATFSDLKFNRPGAGYTLVFSSTSLSAATSGSFNIIAGDASKLVFGTVPSAVDAGSAIAPALTVTATDSAGNLVTSFTGAVTVAIGTNPGGATLSGTLTRNAVAGVATFDNLTLNRRGVGYTLVASAPPFAPATSAPFSVSAGAPTTIAVLAGADQKAVRGSTLAPITVQVRDALGNGIPGLTLALEIEMDAVAADVTPDGATSVPRLRSQMASYGTLSASSVITDQTGSATFTWTLGALVGTQRVEVTLAAPLLQIYISATATPGAVAQLAFTQQPVSRAAGTTFAPVQVTAKDSLGNTVTAFTGTVTLALGAPPCAATLGGTTSVAAVAGVATFNALSLDVACAGYTLSATGDALPSATSAAFNVTPGPAATLNIPGDSGGGQSAAVGTTLSLPFKVLVRDAFLNAVPGVTVTWAVTGGGGSLSATSTVTDASGIAQVTLTLGPAAGTNTVTAASTGLTNSPRTFSATGTVGAATQLMISRQPRASSTAGAADTIIVDVKDAGGNIVAGSTASVTLSIATGPAGATFMGPVTVAAVNGVATFVGTAFDKMGTYTLAFSSAGLASDTSTSVTVTPGWPEFIAADSGAGQFGPAFGLLPNPLVARITDQYGNRVPGRSVTWAVASGGGSLAGATTVSDSGGRVRAQWTLGGTVGSQSVTVTASDTGLTTHLATFTATASAVGYSKRWTGAVSTDWADGGNWAPSGAPTPTDSVQVDSVANMPVLGASTTVGTLRVQPGATVQLASGSVYLGVNGAVTAGLGASITGTGVLQLNGTATIVGPSFPFTKVLGSYLLAGATGFAGDVEVATGGFFNTSGHTANIAGSLSTSGTGTIAMSTPTDVLNVGGNVNLGGGPVSFTTGELRIGGNFTQSGASVFQQNGGFTQFIGAVAKTLSFADTTANSYFFAVTNSGGGAVNLSSPVRLKDKLTILAGAGAVTGTGKALRALGVQLADTTQFAVDTLEIWQPGTMAVTSRIVTNLLVTANPVLLGNTVTLHGNTVIARSGNLVINSRLLVTNSLSTVDAGQLSMTSGLDSVRVNGNASFAGGVTAGTLTNGGISIEGHFSQASNDQAFKAGPRHRTWLAGTGNQTISLAHPDSGSAPGCVSSCFGLLLSSKTAGTVTFLSSAKADSSMLLTGMDSVLAPNLALQARGDFSANARVDGTVRARFVKYAGTIFRTGGTFAVDTLIAYGPGPQLMASEDKPVIVQGAATLPTVMYTLVVVEGPNGVLQTAGKDTVDALVTRNGGRLKMVNAADTLLVRKSAVFVGGPTTGLLTAGTLVVGGHFTALGAAFDASGSHTTVMRSDTARTLAADPQNPSNGFQHLVFEGLGPKNVKFTASYAINVKGNLIARSGSGPVGTDSTSSQVWMRPGSAVYDSTATSEAFRFARLYLSGTTALPKRLVVGDLMVQGAQQLFDSLYTTASINVAGSGSSLDLNGRKLRLAGTNKGFLTEISGTLKMMNPADSLLVDNGNSIVFAGGSTAGLLTNGVIVATGNFTSGGAGAHAQSFAASGQHDVSFVGTGDKVVRMLNGGFGASQFAALYHGTTSALRLRTNVHAESFETGIVATHPLLGDTSFVPLLVSKGADIRDVVFNGVRWELQNGHPVTTLENVTFQNQDPALAQFAIKRTGTDTTGSIAAASGAWNFTTTPTTGAYLALQDTDSPAADTLMLTFSGTVSPASHGGKVLFGGGAKTSWPFGLAISLVTSGDWHVASNWSPAVVPGANDDVTISGERSVTLSANASVRNLTQSTGGLAIGANELQVFGSINSANDYISGTGVVRIAGTAIQNIAVVSVPNLAVNAGATAVLTGNVGVGNDVMIGGRLVVNGRTLDVSNLLSTSGAGGLKMTLATDTVYTYDAAFAGIASDTLLTDGHLVIDNTIQQSGTPLAFAPTGNHVTYLRGSGGGMPAARQAAQSGRLRSVAAERAVPLNRRGRFSANSVYFTHPGYAQSRFNILRFDHTNDGSIVFASHVYANRAEAVGMTSWRDVYGDGAQKLFMKGASLFNLSFDSIAVQVDSGGVITQFDSLSFDYQDPTVDQLTLNLANGSSKTYANLYFGTAPTTGRYLVANTSGTATVNLQTPTPGSHGGKIGLGGGGTVTLTGWQATRAYASVSSTSWNDPATWSPIGVPSRYDDAAISAGHTIALDGDASVRHISMTPTSGVMLGYQTLRVFGNWTADTLSTVSHMSGVVEHYNSTSVSGRLGPAKFYGAAAVTGLTVATSLEVWNGGFDVNGQSVFVHGPFRTDSTGYLRMVNAGGLLQVDGDATFNGASSYPNLTDGVLTLRGSFSQAGDPAAFAATGAHTTIWGSPGNAGRTLRFSNAGNTTTSSHFGILQLADTTQLTAVGSDIWALTKLITTTTGTSITLFRDGSVYTDTAVAPRLHVTDVISTGYLYLNRVMLDVRDATPATVLNNAVFNMFSNSTGETQLTIASASASPLTLNFSGIGFQSTPTSTYRYLHMVNAGTGTVTANFTGMYPSWAVASSKVTTAGSPLPTITWSP